MSATLTPDHAADQLDEARRRARHLEQQLADGAGDVTARQVREAREAVADAETALDVAREHEDQAHDDRQRRRVAELVGMFAPGGDVDQAARRILDLEDQATELLSKLVEAADHYETTATRATRELAQLGEEVPLPSHVRDARILKSMGYVMTPTVHGVKWPVSRDNFTAEAAGAPLARAFRRHLELLHDNQCSKVVPDWSRLDSPDGPTGRLRQGIEQRDQRGDA